jgi:hypothetical protein
VDHIDPFARAIRHGAYAHRDICPPNGPSTADRRSTTARTGREDLLLPTPRQVPRAVPQHPLSLLGRQPASEPSPHVHLGSLDERLTEALVQASAAFLIGSGNVRLRITHDGYVYTPRLVPLNGSGQARGPPT